MKKRIALAAVVALAGGLLVAAPASATSVADAPFQVTTAVSTSGGSTATETATAVAGPYNYVELGTLSATDTVTAGGVLSITGGTFASTTDGTLNAARTEIVFTDTAIATSAIRIMTPSVGTITVVYKSAAVSGGVVTLTTRQTFTITVSAAAASLVYTSSTVKIETATTTTNGVYVDANGAIFASASFIGGAATITTTQLDQNGGVLAAAGTKAVTYTLTGVGKFADGSAYAVVAATSANPSSVVVHADGRTGVASVAVAVNGVVVKTVSVTFYGAAVKFTASIDKTAIAANSADSATVTLTAADASGIAVPNFSFAKSADTTTVTALTPVATSTIGKYTVLTPTFGAVAKIVLGYGNGVADTATVTANYVKSGIKTIAIASDAATYAPGALATLTLTAKNADGVAVADGTVNSVSLSYSTNVVVVSSSATFVGGVATVKVYMPLAQGPVVIKASATDVDGNAISASVTPTVVDAAATANAAAITALQTSVATLTTTVASLVASMTAQIKVINATMLKIQKAIAALRLQVKKLKR